MGQLNFAVSLKLIKDGFERSAQSVNNQLRNIQFQALALAQAFGLVTTSLGGLISKMIDTARETNKARTALKNISQSTSEYSRNLSFLKGISKTYGIELNSTTDAFAKFSAAASASGLTLDTQQKVFTSLSRSIAAFGMSSQEASLTFYAVQQMMSKGKISAEELRRQLGERLPIALQAMANAAGIPVSKMDEMLRKGKLVSSEIIPKFADALTEMTPNVDTNNIEASLNRLQNAFTKFVEDSGIGDFFKRLVDGLTSFLENFRFGWASLIKFLSPLLSIRMVGLLRSYYNQGTALGQAQMQQTQARYEQELKTLERLERQKTAVLQQQEKLRQDIQRRQSIAYGSTEAVQSADKQRTIAEQNYQAQLAQQTLAIDAKKKADLLRAESAYQKELTRIRDAEESARLKLQNPNIKQATRDKLNSQIAGAEAQRLAAEEAYRKRVEQIELRSEAQLKESKAKLHQALEKQKTQITESESRHRRAVEESNQALALQQQKLAGLEEKEQGINQAIAAQRALATSAEQSATQARTAWSRANTAIHTGFQKLSAGARAIWAGMVASMKAVWASLQSMVMSTVIGAVISAVVWAITSLIDSYKRASEYAEDLANANQRLQESASKELADDHQIRQMSDLIDLMERSGVLESERLEAHKKIESVLGEQIASHDELIARAKKYLEVLSAYKAREFWNNKKRELESLVLVEEERLKKENPNLSPEILRAGIPQAKKYHESTLGLGYRSQGEADMIQAAKARGIIVDQSRLSGGSQNNLARAGWNFLSSEAGKEYTKNVEALQIVSKQFDKSAKGFEELSKFNGDWTKKIIGVQDAPTTDTDDGKKKKKSRAQRAEEEFAHDKRALDNRLQAGNITKEEYAEEVRKVARRLIQTLIEEMGGKAASGRATFQQARQIEAAYPELSSEEKKYQEALESLTNQLRNGAITQEEFNDREIRERQRRLEELAGKSTLTERETQELAELQAMNLRLRASQTEYRKQLDELVQSHKSGQTSERDFQKALIELKLKTLNSIASKSNVTKAELEYADSLRKEVSSHYGRLRELTFGAEAEPADRDASDISKDKDLAYRKQFDQKSGRKDLEEEYKRAGEELKFLQEQAGRTGQALKQEIAGAMSKVSSTAQKLKLSIIMEDIDKATDDIMKNTKGLHSGLSSLRTSFKEIRDAFDPDSQRDGWERFFGVFSGIFSVIEGITSLIHAIEGISTALSLLKTATAAKDAVESAGRTAQLAQEGALAGTHTATAVAAKALSVANTSLAASNVFLAHSLIPFAGVPLATGQVLAMKATMTAVSLPTFESGGVVGGNSYSGDRVLARVNSGEMILNAQQQGRLFRMANGLTRPDGQGNPNKLDVVLSGEAVVRGDSLRIALARAIRKHER